QFLNDLVEEIVYFVLIVAFTKFRDLELLIDYNFRRESHVVTPITWSCTYSENLSFLISSSSRNSSLLIHLRITLSPRLGKRVVHAATMTKYPKISKKSLELVQLVAACNATKRMIMTMKNTTIKDRSSDTCPRRNGGINRRKKRSGGSVAVMTSSAIMRLIPRGRQSRAKELTSEYRTRTTRIKK